MTLSAEPGGGAHRVRITAAMDRRRAEAVALQLRRRLKQLGFDGATITVTPSHRRTPVEGVERDAPP
jgi:hypothetical protein